MCGIAGQISYCEPRVLINRDAIERMRESMRKRGPDGSGIWHEPSRGVSFAHVRLAIIDLSSSGNQPMLDPETGNRIVFNGEIYNYKELQIELRAAGVKLNTNSDTEVILKLYSRFGPGMLHRLRGMFSLAIWDVDKNAALLARDLFGIKPLYYHDDGFSIRFASQVKAIVAGGEIPCKISSAGITGFFLWGNVPEPYTWCDRIMAFPPGTYAWVDKDGLGKPKEFSSWKEIIENRQIISSDTSSDLPSLSEAVSDSVRAHMVADVPVGLFLSAGIDSAAIAGHIKQLGRNNVRTITIGFSEYAGTNADEMPLAMEIARKYGFPHQSHVISENDFAAAKDCMVADMDQPTIDGVNTYLVSKIASEYGVKVALSGIGGDELFEGYSGFKEIAQLRRILSTLGIGSVIGTAARLISSWPSRAIGKEKYAGILEYGSSWSGGYLLRRSLFMPWEIVGILDPGMAREGLSKLNTLAELDHCQNGLKNGRRRIQSMESVWYMRNQLLRDADWAGMAHGVEIRVPFVDKVLWDRVAAMRSKGMAISKMTLANSVASKLPRAVTHKKKTGFSIPVSQWVSKKGKRGSERGLRAWAIELAQKFTNEIDSNAWILAKKS